MEVCIEAFVNGLPAEIKPIVSVLRDLAWRHLPDAAEILFYDGLGYTLDESLEATICTISPSQECVALGFPFGCSLPDPSGLLEGEGHSARYVKVRDLACAKRLALEILIRTAGLAAPSQLVALRAK